MLVAVRKGQLVELRRHRTQQRPMQYVEKESQRCFLVSESNGTAQ